MDPVAADYKSAPPNSLTGSATTMNASGHDNVDPIYVEVSPGELIDKIVILEIKQERVTEADKRDNVQRELAILRACRQRSLPDSADLAEWTASLKKVNEELWEIEDAIRECERVRDFGPRFID